MTRVTREYSGNISTSVTGRTIPKSIRRPPIFRYSVSIVAPVCVLNSSSKPQQMPDCGFVSLTRRLTVTAGYNSRNPHRERFFINGTTPSSPSPPHPSPCASSPSRHSTCHASRNANLIVERILDIAAPFISRRRLHRRNEFNIESILYAKITCYPELVEPRYRATVTGIYTTISLKATRRSRSNAQSSIIESRETRE